MKNFLIVGLTLLLSWFIIKILDKRGKRDINKIIYRQSNIYENIKEFMPKNLFDKPEVMSQSKKHIQKNMIKVVIHNDKAYWISENMFYTADAINGRVDQSTIRQLDIDNMSKNDIEVMMDILDTLRKGDGLDDSRSPGDNRV